jgi:hypothetical protein
MAYSADIDATSPDHRWSFDGVYTDSIGSINGVNTGLVNGGVCCQDVSNAVLTNGTNDRVTLATSTDINGALSQKGFGGWFRVSTIQQPPCRIYGEGNNATSFAMLLGFGNNVTFEIDSNDFTLQIFGDVPLEAGRNYHLWMGFDGSGGTNEFRAYLDGVKQLKSSNTSLGFASLGARSVGEFGDPVGTVAMGGIGLVIVAAVNGNYNQWASWSGANAMLSDTTIREELFEKGALPTLTVTSQGDLDAIASTTRTNSPLDILVDVVGDITLTADNISFNELSSINVQYNGTGTLTWINRNGSNATKTSTTGGGTIVLTNEVDISFTMKSIVDGTPIENVRILMKDSSDNTVLSGVTDVSGKIIGQYLHESDDTYTIRCRKVLYQQTKASGTITVNGIDSTLLMIGDT